MLWQSSQAAEIHIWVNTLGFQDTHTCILFNKLAGTTCMKAITGSAIGAEVTSNAAENAQIPGFKPVGKSRHRVTW
jgi:hypothetical protein